MVVGRAHGMHRVHLPRGLPCTSVRDELVEGNDGPMTGLTRGVVGARVVGVGVIPDASLAAPEDHPWPVTDVGVGGRDVTVNHMRLWHSNLVQRAVVPNVVRGPVALKEHGVRVKVKGVAVAHVVAVVQIVAALRVVEAPPWGWARQPRFAETPRAEGSKDDEQGSEAPKTK